MPRPNENRILLRCRMKRDKKTELDQRLIDAGFCYKSGDFIYPQYAEFLEALIDGDSRAYEIIFQKVLDKME